MELQNKIEQNFRYAVTALSDTPNELKMRCVIISQLTYKFFFFFQTKRQHESSFHYVYKHLLRELNDGGNYLINLMRLCEIKCFESLKLECVVITFCVGKKLMF